MDMHVRYSYSSLKSIDSYNDSQWTAVLYIHQVHPGKPTQFPKHELFGDSTSELQHQMIKVQVWTSLTCEKWAKVGSESIGTCPISSWHTSL